jgi:hypothetical protein
MEGEVLSWLSEQVAEYLQTESLGTTVSNSLWGCAAPYQGESRIQSRCPERELDGMPGRTGDVALQVIAA